MNERTIMEKEIRQVKDVPVVAQEEKLLLVCSICGGKDISATSEDGEYYGTVQIIVPDSERGDFYKNNVDPYNFYCGDCDADVELLTEQDYNRFKK